MHEIFAQTPHRQTVATLRRRQAAARTSGFVTLAVMIVILLVTLACYQFVAAAVGAHRAAAARADRLALDMCAASAEQLVMTSLRTTADAAVGDAGQRRYDEPPPPQERFAGVAVGGTSTSSRQPHFTVVSTRLDADGRVRLQYGPACTSAQLSLAAVADWERGQAGRGVTALASLPGIDPPLAAQIVSLLIGAPVAEPTEVLATASGLVLGSRRPLPRAVAPTPAASRTPDAWRDPLAPLAVWRGATLDELLAVPAVTRATLWGGDRNANGVVSAWESALGSAAPAAPRTVGSSESVADAAPWSAYVTLYSAERNVNSRGEPRIFVNQPDLVALDGQLSGRLPRTWVEFIMAYRRYGPAGGAALAPGTASGFPLGSIYDLIGAAVSVPAGSGSAQILASPFGSDRAALREYLVQLADEVTVDARPVIPGRINVNLAPRHVLRAIPGADDQLVERILGARERQEASASTAPARRHASWLVAEGWIEPVWMRQLEPFVTAGGDVYSAQIVAFFAAGEGAPPERQALPDDLAVRYEVLLDAARTDPRPLVRRDLSNLGRGYAREALKP